MSFEVGYVFPASCLYLQDYLSCYRDWGSPPAPLKTLCPIDHSQKLEGNTEAAGGENGASVDSLLSRNEPSFVQTVDANGKNVILCNFNGVTFQVHMQVAALSIT